MLKSCFEWHRMHGWIFKYIYKDVEPKEETSRWEYDDCRFFWSLLQV